MRRHILSLACALWSLVIISTWSDGRDTPSGAAATSPDGQIRIEVSLAKRGEGRDSPVYLVSFRGRPVILPSRLGVDSVDGLGLGNDSTIESVQKRTINETYTQHPGKRSRVVNHCEEVVVMLRERAAPTWRWEIIIRAYDDGVGIRYRIPKQENQKSLTITGECTQLALPGNAVAYALPLNGYTSSHEARYQKKVVAEIPKEWLLGLPVLAELQGTGSLAMMEANLTDYAGMYLVRDAEGGAVLASRLSPRPGEPKVAVRADLPHESPWRVLMIADKVERLVESDLVLNLNAPCALADTSWIRPGKTTFPWWNGFHEDKVPFQMGLNTETAKYYIDFCAEAGIPYHSLDGKGDTAWYGGPIVPYQGADITRGVEGLDLKEVLRYAATKGVKIRLWMNWRVAEAHMDRAFPLYHEWGVEGVMLDFMDRDDQVMVNFLRRALETAAANRLTVTLHGVSAPTGLERTYPNLLTNEGVLNLECDKWDKHGVPPEHELTVPFTRMLAGPLDFHQGSFRSVPVEEFRPRNEAPLVIGTPCRMLASYVVFQNHLPMVADYPSAYRGHPALPVLVAIPTMWGRYVLPGRQSRGVYRHRPAARFRVVGRYDGWPRIPRGGDPAGIPRSRSLPGGDLSRRSERQGPHRPPHGERHQRRSSSSPALCGWRPSDSPLTGERRPRGDGSVIDDLTHFAEPDDIDPVRTKGTLLIPLEAWETWGTTYGHLWCLASLWTREDVC
jgi:alpha-glucosidase